MKIAVLTRGKGLQQYYKELIGGDIDITSVLPDESEIPIAGTARDHLNFIEAMKRAEKEGYDAAIPSCHADPGVEEARTYCSIPIIGVGQMGLHFATMLGHKFSILTPSQGIRRNWQRRVETSGYAARLASIKSHSNWYKKGGISAPRYTNSVGGATSGGQVHIYPSLT